MREIVKINIIILFNCWVIDFQYDVKLINVQANIDRICYVWVATYL